MKILSLTISSYKSFTQQSVIPFSSRFNVLIGPNNCGKTNVLDAISFLAAPSRNPERLHHHRADVTMTVDLSPEEQNRLTVSRRVEFRGVQYDVRAYDSAGKALNSQQANALAAKVKILEYDDFLDLEQIQRDYTNLAQSYPEVFAKLSELLTTYFPEVNEVERVVDDNLERFGSIRTQESSITIDRLGGGFQRVLIMLLYALHPEYPIVLIDEPEIHLHPGMIKRLQKIFNSSVTNQLIVTSHSPLFVTADSLAQVYRVLKDERGSHVYALAQGRGRIDRQRLVQELNADNLEMFFADKVLLVEGVSDRILMRSLIDRFYRGPYDIKVIQTHGKSNIDVYMDLMSIFHIPYLVLLDRDALPALAQRIRFDRTLPRARNRREWQAMMIKELQRYNIFILDNGTIEANYPRRYQSKDSKPLNALYASANITPAEYRSSTMRNLREIIDRL